MDAIRNPSTTDLQRLLGMSASRTLRRIADPQSGDHWYWPAEQGTHAEGAAVLGIPYDRPPGAGDIVVG